MLTYQQAQQRCDQRCGAPEGFGAGAAALASCLGSFGAAGAASFLGGGGFSFLGAFFGAPDASSAVKLANADTESCMAGPNLALPNSLTTMHKHIHRDTRQQPQPQEVVSASKVGPSW